MSRSFLVALFVVSAALPILGFSRLLWRVQRQFLATRRLVAERGHSGFAFDDLDALDVLAPVEGERRDLVWDLIFVGVGLIAGAVASIVSLPE